jgi:hypothetical protein
MSRESSALFLILHCRVKFDENSTDSFNNNLEFFVDAADDSGDDMFDTCYVEQSINAMNLSKSMNDIYGEVPRVGRPLSLVLDGDKSFLSVSSKKGEELL